MALAREASRMGNGRTTRRASARQARRDRTAQAASAPAPIARGGLAGSTALSPGVARTDVGAHHVGSAGLPTIRCEQPLAFGTPWLLGALGVRRPEQHRWTQGGDPAGVWLWQPTGW